MQLAEIVMPKRQALRESFLGLDLTRSEPLLGRALQVGYNAVLLTPTQFLKFQTQLSDRITKIVTVDTDGGMESFASLTPSPDLVIASCEGSSLSRAQARGFRTGYRVLVDSASTLHAAIQVGKLHDVVMMSFKDPTNIPLELVIASLQASQTILIKEIAPHDIDDAVVTLGVMEVGADGILFTPSSETELEVFLSNKNKGLEKPITLSVGEVVTSKPVGMGYRSCIDLATLFTPTEGMIIGSTSQGGILCCPEVFHLPYMELRPFRVNAGAVHSYVFNLDNRTDYMTELKAGSPVMIAQANGNVRRAYVGRMKTEVRPLRLIEVAFEGERRVNLLLQDDWHVRIYSDDAKPINITELRKGSKVLGHVTDPGRHVGIKVSEHILEN